MWARCTWLLLMVGLLPSLASQDRLSSLGQSLKAQYEGKTVTLRNSYAGNRLAFDVAGNLRGDASSGPWTTCAKFEVTQVRLANENLSMDGRRFLLRYDRDSRSFVDIGMDPAVTESLTEPLRETLKRAQELQLEVALANGEDAEQKLRIALDKIFLAETEKLAVVAPDYWSLFLDRLSPPSIQEVETALSERELGYRAYRSQEFSQPGFVIPRQVQQSNPRFTELARIARISGSILVSVVVDQDGKVVKPQIIVPMGLGLDESVVSQIVQWRFEPARLYGQPVAAQAEVTVSFQLK